MLLSARFLWILLASSFQFHKCVFGCGDLTVSEYNALYRLWNSTRGYNWTYPSLGNPWQFPSPVNAPCNDSWIGVGCSCKGNSSSVIELKLDNTNLFGTIPPDIIALENLVIFSVFGNLLYGTLPDLSSLGLNSLALGQNRLTGTLQFQYLPYSTLISLTASDNHFEGPLPTDFKLLSFIIELDLSLNYFTGTMPPSLDNEGLQNLQLNNNVLEGQISSISLLRKITSLYFDFNMFSGTLPSLKYNFKLTELSASYNMLKGSLQDIENKDALVYLNIAGNTIGGNLYEILPKMPLLTSLYVEQNVITGTLPLDVITSRKLQIINIAYNKLTGHLPNASAPFKQLLNISSNYFDGSVPALFSDGMYSMVDLSYNYLSGTLAQDFLLNSNTFIFGLTINNNYFSGSLPQSFSSFTGALSLLFQYNFFSSTIPEDIGRLLNLYSLYLHANSFSGTIPESLGQLSSLNFLSLYNNKLTGTLPKSILNLNLLSQIQLQNNKLSGNFFSVINSTSNPVIQILNIEKNLFTGTIPYDLFQFQHLTGFAAVENCFSGLLPTEICSSPASSTLTVLALDGLGSNPDCQRNKRLSSFLPRFINGITQVVALSTKIPKCYMALPNLRTLHLSGNGLTGTIPDLKINSSIIDLSLSNNALSGTIPDSIQRHSFKRLDLTNNRLGGELRSDFKIDSSQTLLTLSINRLSGQLPESISHSTSNLTDLNVLASNIFGCTNSEVPDKDPFSQIYYCGSYTLNISSYVWLALTIALALIIFIASRIFYRSQLHEAPNMRARSFAEAEIYLHEKISADREGHADKWDDVNAGDNVKSMNILLLSTGPRSGFLSAICSRIFEYLAFTVTIIRTWHAAASNLLKAPTFSDRKSVVGISSDIDVNQASSEGNNDSSSNYGKSNQNDKLNSTASSRPSDVPLSGLKSLLLFYRLFNYFSGSIGVFLCVVLIPVFIVLNAYGSIVSYSYGFILSIAFTHGSYPVIVCGTVVVVILLLTTSIADKLKRVFVRYIGPANSPSKDIQASSSPVQTKFVIKKYFLIIIFHVFNLLVTVSVNASYASIGISPSSNLTRSGLVCIQIAVGAFKLMWNVTYIPWCCSVLQEYMSSPRVMQNWLFLSVTNFILAPCISTIGANQSCFYYVFHSHPGVTSTADLEVCSLFSADGANIYCYETTLTSFSTTYNPSFVYSYACGSALLEIYIPVLMYSNIGAGIFGPLCRLLFALHPKLMWPVNAFNKMLDFNTSSILSKSDGADPDIKVSARSSAVSVMVQLCLLMTFGIACPILGITIVSTILNNSQVWKLLIGRILSTSPLGLESGWGMEGYLRTRSSRLSGEEMESLEIESREVWLGVFACFNIVLIVTTTFWALLFFDMVADRNGTVNGLIVLGIFGVLLPILFIAYRHFLPKYRALDILGKLSRRIIHDLNIDDVMERSISETNSKNASPIKLNRGSPVPAVSDPQFEKNPINAGLEEDNIVMSFRALSFSRDSNISGNSNL